MSVYSKLYSYVNSPAGQANIQSTLNNYIASGRATTPSGQKLVNADVAYDLAQKLGNIIMSHIPGNISNSINSMVCNGPFLVNGGRSYECDLHFDGDLSRPSLSGDGGVSNIVALFNNGYLASDYVYGWWDSHDIAVRSKLYREPLQFMQDAVNEFNSIYGKQYNVSVTLAGIYEEVPTLSKTTTAK